MEIRLKSVRLKLLFDTTAIILLFKQFFVTRFQSEVKMSPIAAFLRTGKELHMDLFQCCQLYARLQAACINDLSPN